MSASLCCSCQTFKETLKTREDDATFQETRGLFHPDDSDDGAKDFVLHFTVSENHVDCVASVLKDGEDVNQLSKLAGRTALMMAARKGFGGVMDYLLDHGADINVQDGMSNTALFYAASDGHVSCLSRLLEGGADFKTVSKYSKLTPLTSACFGGHIACVQELLDHGDKFGMFDHTVQNMWFTFSMTMCDLPSSTVKSLLTLIIDREGALSIDVFMGVVNKNDKEILAELLDKNVTIKDTHNSAVSVDYNEAMHNAAENSNEQTLEVLLSRSESLGIKINSCIGLDRRTPLQKACDQDELRVVEVLLEHGADPDLAVSKLREYERPPVFMTLRTLSYMHSGLHVLGALIKHGCNLAKKLTVNLRGLTERVSVTALEYALYGCNLYAARMLVLGGAQNYNSSWAASKPHKKVVHKGLECTRRERDQFVTEELSSPHSLYLLCRVAVRTCIHGQAQPKIQQLPIARHVQEFISYRDLDEIAAEYSQKMEELEINSSDEQEASGDSFSGDDSGSDSDDDSDDFGGPLFYDDDDMDFDIYRAFRLHWDDSDSDYYNDWY